MSTEQEKKVAALAELLHLSHKSYQVEPSCEGCAAQAIRLLDNGVDVTLPPELQWEPGQYVMLENPYAHERVIAQRSGNNAGWLIPGVAILYGDDEVTDIEPVAVLTAEDVRELRKNRGISNFARFFRERGLDV